MLIGVLRSAGELALDERLQLAGRDEEPATDPDRAEPAFADRCVRRIPADAEPPRGLADRQE
jgi:hypothetical protein